SHRPQPRRDDLRQRKVAQRLRPDQRRRTHAFQENGRYAVSETEGVIVLATVLGAISLWQVLPRSEVISGRIIAKLSGVAALVFAAFMVYLYLAPPPYVSVIDTFGSKPAFWLFVVALVAIALFFILPRFGKVQARAIGIVLGLVSLG